MGRAAALAGRRVRLAWLLLLSVVAVSLASFTLLVAALSWVEFRNLSRSLQGWGEHGNQHQTGRAAAMEAARSNASTRLGFLQALLNSKAVLRKRRERSRGSGTKHKPSFAAHFEVVPMTDDGTYIVEKGGVIRQWAERSIQVRNHPLTYNNTTGDFMVKKEGVYYIYSQLHLPFRLVSEEISNLLEGQRAQEKQNEKDQEILE
ncbi:tumor necrosis factor ligand superfamily member 12 [Leucoraja erinacea]|uniref:tumor necrosis factor ligand superfamily member 12 n=1 Tax=Leucoraja erinaceus TaxID=7782 RepID=UPI002456B9CD|nr:tumor necrosis factor ligand superfamily member 12 [Leucoraja erinacea]